MNLTSMESKQEQPRTTLKDYMRAALNAAKNGTEEQQDDLSGLVGQLSQCSGELRDQISGVRKQEDHPHHPKPALQEAISDGIKLINENISSMSLPPLPTPNLKEFEIDQ